MTTNRLVAWAPQLVGLLCIPALPDLWVMWTAHAPENVGARWILLSPVVFVWSHKPPFSRSVIQQHSCLQTGCLQSRCNPEWHVSRWGNMAAAAAARRPNARSSRELGRKAKISGLGILVGRALSLTVYLLLLGADSAPCCLLPPSS